jgi:hypothetical protein
MAYRYHIDPDSKTVLISFSGHSSMDEAIRLRQELRSDPLFRSTLNELVDLGRLKLKRRQLRRLRHARRPG